MNSRRLMCCPQAEDCALPQRDRKYGVYASQQNSAANVLEWVINVVVGHGRASRHVCCSPFATEMGATQ
jgi:hypothetical protein